jgi:integrase
LNREQIVRLLAACDGYEDQDAANAIRMLLFTGARLREVLNAPWTQFDLEAGVWSKPSHHTKTKKQHRVQLSGVVIQMLRTMRKVSRSQWLFPGRSLDTHRVDLKRPWKVVSKCAGLRETRIHDLRRTYASFMLSGGASLDAVGQALGHTQLSTTQRYAFLAPDVQREAANKAMAAMGLVRAA